MSAAWTKKNISLPFWLGEICLFRKSFHMHTLNVDFIKYDPDHSGQITSPNDGTDTNGYMLYSVPLKSDHKVLWREEGKINYISKTYNRYYIELNSTYDEYLNKFSSKTRTTFRRKIRKFEKESGGSLEWKIFSTPEEISDFHKIARGISIHTYQEKLLNAGLPEDEAFIERMMRDARNNLIRGYILYLNGKPVSYLYAPIENGIMSYAFLGYLPETSKLSPGIVLFLKALEHLFEEKVADIFDFTEGQSDQKKQFSTNYVYCGNLVSLDYTITNHFWLWLHKNVNTLSAALGRFLDWVGLKAVIKKALRK